MTPGPSRQQAAGSFAFQAARILTAPVKTVQKRSRNQSSTVIVNGERSEDTHQLKDLEEVFKPVHGTAKNPFTEEGRAELSWSDLVIEAIREAPGAGSAEPFRAARKYSTDLGKHVGRGRF